MSCLTFKSESLIVLLDIEGTTTSISFVKEELFPYILKSVESYLTSTYSDEQTQADINALRALAAQDLKDGVEGCIMIPDEQETQEVTISETVRNVQWQMSVDRKSTALKQLQGHMWLNAYKQGEVKGHLYEEVSDCIRKWVEEDGKKVCIYSSGSVAAQKLLFQHSIDGDLTYLLSNYFDTNVGGKRESESYENIAKQLKVSANEIVFLTDVVQEADAAVKAGMNAVIVIRPGNSKLSEEDLKKHKTISSFNQLQFLPESNEPEVKKKKH